MKERLYRGVLVGSMVLWLSGCNTDSQRTGVDVSPDMSARGPVSFLANVNEKNAPKILSRVEQPRVQLKLQPVIEVPKPAAALPSSPTASSLSPTLPKPALRVKPRPRTNKFESHLVQDFINNVAWNEFARVRNTLAAAPDMVNAVTRDGDMAFPSVNTVEMAELLLSRGADINSTTRKNETALILQFFGINDKAQEVVRFLLAQGADVTVQDKYGESVLFRVGDNPELVNILVARGADVNIQNNGGETPLHHVIQTGRVRCIEELLKAGADVGKKTRDGATPLHYATRNSFSESIVELLIKYGADVNVEMQNGRRPLDNAVQQGSYKVVALLKAHGARQY